MLKFWKNSFCITHWQVTKRKDKFKLLMPIMTLSMCESTRFWVKSRKTGDLKRYRGNMQRYPRADPHFRGTDPHLQTAGSWESPPSRPCTRSSGQGPGIPTPWEWNLWTDPWRSTVPEMKTHFTNGPWGGFFVSHKMKRGQRGKAQFSWSNILIDPLKAAWSKLLVSNLISNFLFFLTLWYPAINMNLSHMWTIHQKYTY